MGMTIKYKLEIKKKREIIKHSIYYIHKTLTQEVISIYIISKFYRITHLLKKILLNTHRYQKIQWNYLHFKKEFTLQKNI